MRMPSTEFVVFASLIGLLCALRLFMFFMELRAARRARAVRFRLICGVSEELGRIVERVPPEELTKVVDAALEITAGDFPGDADIERAIGAYRTERDPDAARLLASKLTLAGAFCGLAYHRLEMAPARWAPTGPLACWRRATACPNY